MQYPRHEHKEAKMDHSCKDAAKLLSSLSASDSGDAESSRRSFLKTGGGVLAMGTAQSLLAAGAMAQN